jgi:hypothetical protein
MIDTNTHKLNYISEMMLKAYSANIDSKGWLQEKAQQLADFDSNYEAFRELGRMDAKNKATFAELLDVSVDDLDAVKRVFQKF